MTSREKRCEDCVCLIKCNGKWCCDEMNSTPCNEIENCPEGIELEEVQEIQKKGESVKIKHGAGMVDKSEKTERTPRKVKTSDEKTQIFSEIVEFLSEKYEIEVLTENKLVQIALNGHTFKLNLSENRAKKA